MSDEPARPEEAVGGTEGGEAPPQADQPNEPAELTIVQEPEMAAQLIAPPETADIIPEEKKPEVTADIIPEEKKPEVEEPEKKESPDKAVPEGEQKEPPIKADAKPAESASEFPLADSNVLAELKAAEGRAREAAKAIEALKGQLAASTKKDVMTEEDIQMMEQKQKELMEKMQEFEDITKKIQQLVGLVDVPSSQLGLPQKPLVPSVEGAKTEEPQKQSTGQPMDTLPKVIICGTSDIDEVPKIIVCEPTSARNGKQPLYHQIKNDNITGKATSKMKVSDTKGPSDQDQTGKATPPTDLYTGPGCQGYPGGLPGQGAMGCVRPFGDGNHMGMVQPGMGQAGFMQPGMGQSGMVQPGMGQAGFMQPGMGQAGMVQPGMGQAGIMQPGMGQAGLVYLDMGQAGMIQPGMGQAGMMQPNMGRAGMMQPNMGQAGMMQPGVGQSGMMCPGLGQAGMIQPGVGQAGMMQTWMQPGMMQYGGMQPGMAQFGMVQPGMAQPSGTVMPGICTPCGHPRKQKSHRTKDTNEENDGSVVKASGQNPDRSKNDGSDTKKSCRKKKRCYCQISGLCEFNNPPFPTT